MLAVNGYNVATTITITVSYSNAHSKESRFFLKTKANIFNHVIDYSLQKIYSEGSTISK